MESLLWVLRYFFADQSGEFVLAIFLIEKTTSALDSECRKIPVAKTYFLITKIWQLEVRKLTKHYFKVLSTRLLFWLLQFNDSDQFI